MTYEEHKKAKIKLYIEDNKKEYNELLRNIVLRPNDLKDGLLTTHFFKREDVSEMKKEKLEKFRYSNFRTTFGIS